MRPQEDAIETPARRRIVLAGLVFGTLAALTLSLAPELVSGRGSAPARSVARVFDYDPSVELPRITRIEALPVALPAGFAVEDLPFALETASSGAWPLPPPALLGVPLAGRIDPKAATASATGPLPAVSAVGSASEPQPDPAPPTRFEMDDFGGGRDSELNRGANCILAPWEVVEIKSVVRGRIEQLPAERSDPVHAGDVVVVIDARAERAATALARARAEMKGAIRSREAALALGKRREGRTGQLFERRAVGLEALDQAETEASLARHELERAQEERRLASLDVERALASLDQRRIESPISGVVLERFLSAGEVVDHEPILRIAQIDPLRVEVILPAERFGTLRPGMRAAVVPELPGDRQYEATVELVDAVIDPASGTFGARLRLPNPDHAIPSGLNCQVSFQAD